MFTPEMLSESLFREQALSAEATGIKASGLPTGAFPRENGDVLLRFRVPGARSIRLHAEVSNRVFADVDLRDCGNGYFEGVLPYRESLTGPANVRVYVNGAEVLVPDLPVIWTDNRPQNNLEIPDPEMEYLFSDQDPHGQFIREKIWAKGTGLPADCMIYTPPEYAEGTAAYPVLYLLHGSGDNERMWEYVGRLSRILDRLWAEGKAKPFITVMMNGMLRRDGTAHMPVDKAFEITLTESCIPFVERRYRVLKDRRFRAIAGLSMGAYMSCDIGFAHPELFSSIGTFTASMTSEPGMMEYERPYPAVLAKGPEEFEKKYALYWRSTTPQENHLDFFEADDALLRESGIDRLPCTHRKLYPPRTSKWNSWRMGLRDFAQLVFQD